MWVLLLILLTKFNIVKTKKNSIFGGGVSDMLFDIQRNTRIGYSTHISHHKFLQGLCMCAYLHTFDKAMNPISHSQTDFQQNNEI